MQIGDRVRFIGTVSDDIYHGFLCGQVGVIRQLYPWIGIDIAGHGVYAVNRECLEKIQ